MPRKARAHPWHLTHHLLLLRPSLAVCVRTFTLSGAMSVLKNDTGTLGGGGGSAMGGALRQFAGASNKAAHVYVPRL